MTHKYWGMSLMALLALAALLPHARSQAEVEADLETDGEAGGSMDEIISEAANSTSEFEFFYDEGNSLLKVELDMVYTIQEWGEIEAANNVTAESTSVRKKRTAGIIDGRGGGRRWTGNVVNYQLSSVFSQRDRGVIQAAINDWERYTCLDFRNRRASNYIYMKNGGGCYSRVGMVGGSQELGLAPGCRQKGVVIHEIGHALGLHHEQTRPDRDNYVSIIRRNIPSRMYYNFQKNTWNVIQQMGIPYDYTSIMHYGKTAFSVNGGLTIQTRDPKYQNVIGNRHGLSFGDIKSINIMYNCKRHSSGCTKTDSQCPGEGFVDKNCNCICHGGSLSTPTKSCGGGGGGARTTRRPVIRTTRRPVIRTTRRPTPTGCRDQHRSCRRWAGMGECSKNPSYMHVYCKQSCNKCGGTASTCKDFHRNCPIWSRNRFCQSYRYASYMRYNCKRSCGFCNSGYRTGTGSGTNAGAQTSACVDNDTVQCPQWARIGECTRNPAYMLTACKRSCHQCVSASNVAVTTNIPCVNRHTYCSYWASTGQCVARRGYMITMCRAACRFC